MSNVQHVLELNGCVLICLQCQDGVVVCCAGPVVLNPSQVPDVHMHVDGPGAQSVPLRKSGW